MRPRFADEGEVGAEYERRFLRATGVLAKRAASALRCVPDEVADAVH